MPGDAILAEDLIARLRGAPLAGRALPVDLERLAELLEVDPAHARPAFVDLATGSVVADEQTDPAMVGDESAVDVEAEPDRWLTLEPHRSRAAWEDMAAFADTQVGSSQRERLTRAIEGKGAFRRFRDAVYDADLGERWRAFAEDRRWGRAREALAAAGIRVG